MYKIFTAIKCRWPAITQFYSGASACCLSLVLSVLFVSGVRAQGAASKITLNVTNASLENVVASIQQQSGYDFVYAANLLKTGKSVTLTISSSSISDVLDKCLFGQPLTYTITRKTVTIRPKSEPLVPPATTEKKSVPVVGLVTDEKDQPLPGVTIKDKQSGKVSISDKDGHYQIAVESNAVLVFSFIGYETLEVLRRGKMEININMKPQKSGLNEVVVIGYGTTRKSDLTASVSSISKEAMSQRTLFSLADAIKGKAAGVQITQNDGTPGSENTIRIRGASSVSASSAPLYVIDGVMQDDANNISPGDIENIEILKDASGTAIYGSRGANGVILITTKSGKSGKTQVEFYGNTGYQTPAHLYNLMNSSEYVHRQYLANYVYSPASTANPNTPASTLTGYNYYRDTPLGTPGGFWGIPTTSPYSTWQNYTSPDSVNTNWQKALFQHSLVQEYRLSVQGGTKDTKYAFLGGYLNQGGLIVFSDYQRYNGRFNFQQNLSKSVSVTSNISFTRNNIDGFTASASALNGGIVSNPIITSMLQQPPINPLTFTDIEDNAQQAGYISTNPYSLAKYVANNRNVSELITRFALDWTIDEHFSFRSTGTLTYTNSNTDAYYPKNVSAGAKFNGRAVLSRGVTNRYLNENLLYYKMQINKDNRINAFVGATFEQSKYSLITAENQNYNVETLGVFGLSNGTTPIIPTYTITKYTIASFLGRVEYSLKNKYLFTTTMRADGSSRFSANNKWSYFPSAALAWRASEENFFKSINAISNLKFRASIGQSGNTAIPSYLTLSTIATYFSPINGNTPSYGVVVDRPENLSLKWETTTQMDGGVDLGLFHDRLNLTIDWYLKRTKDLLIQKVTPGYSGYRNTWTNLGSIQNSGLEVDINGLMITNKNFSWNVGANIGFNRSKAIQIGDQLSLAPGVVSGIGTSAIIQNGQPLGQWYGYQTNGIFQSQAEINASGLTEINGIAIASVRPGTRKFMDINGDHKIDANDRTILGQGQPVFTGGLTNSVTYKGFNLNVVVQYSYGNKIYNANRVALESGRNVNNSNTVLANSWRPNLYDNTTGVLVEAGNFNNSYRMPGSPEENLMLSDWIEDGSYIRLSDVTLSYQFKSQFISKIGLRGLTLFSSGKNLWLWSKYSGYDPEVNTRQGGFGDLMPSLDYASYPRSRVYSLGIRAQF
jgi:TonB-linked SusC/RagA family outer membrane protein